MKVSHDSKLVGGGLLTGRGGDEADISHLAEATGLGYLQHMSRIRRKWGTLSLKKAPFAGD